ncbi:hypothetical protein TRFO_13810 [Tritrichomonas foetus]|uniref:Uncharacterized protein n=1 Tax=Tritrichomonas foetus TaxID=1144522 RepID=A0A1J4KWY6_9EUKA|nr:hypothetical protein TRFO_13810 [Tritrichomonas foetus]|eukprot:OHT15801.1 hypothetical protein TRFO_13810 [Tritrichomonas foetus]
MNFTPITTIPSSTNFCALISNEELLQIRSNTVSIISVRTGFCKFFYFLPQIPRLFSINPLSPSRFALVYPSNGVSPESIALLETETGRVLKQFALKSPSQKFLHIAVGSHFFFVIDQFPNTVFFSQFSGNHVSQYESSSPVVYLGANYSNSQFFILRNDKHVVVVDTNGSKLLNDIPFNPFSFITLNDAILTYGSPDGLITILNLTTGENKAIQTPHSTKPLAVAEGFSVTVDGIVFSTDTGEVVATVSSPISIRSNGSTLAVVCESCIEIFESAKRPICTVSQLQPPEPFVDSQFSVEPSIFFAASTAIYSFTISLNEISKFTSFNEKIKKIAHCQACVSIIYNSPEGDKIATFATGIKKRDELGIDVICDINDRTWILQKDSILTYQRQHLDLEELGKIELPENHSFSRIFRIGQTVAVYSPTEGIAAYVKNGQLIHFRLPQNVTIIQWPALCTKNNVFICRRETDAFEELTVDDFTFISASISSCCWLAKTLFAVENRNVLALGINGSKRIIDRLPNTTCTIAAALPSELIFVTTLPDLRVVTIKRPFLFVALLDLCPTDIECFKYMLSYMPSLPVDPRAITGLPPIIAMSVFNKAPPKYVTPKTVEIYSKFAKFSEVFTLTKSNNSNTTTSNNTSNFSSNNTSNATSNKSSSTGLNNVNRIIKIIADAAAKVGQFGIAQQLYEEIGDDDSLFQLFMINRSSHNLRVLASRSPLRNAIQYFGIQPEPGEYEKLPNLQLPKIKEPFKGVEFILYAGDSSEGAPLFPPSFDELSDFGLREYPLTGEEAQQEIQLQAELDNVTSSSQLNVNLNSNSMNNSSSNLDTESGAQESNENGSNTEKATDIEYKERPVEEKKSDDELKLDKFFDDDEEEPQKTISFAIDMTKAPMTRRGGALKATFQLDTDSSGSGQITLPKPMSAPENGRRRTMTARTKKFAFDIPGVSDQPGASEAPVTAGGALKANSSSEDLTNLFKSEDVSFRFSSQDPLSGGKSSGQTSDNESGHGKEINYADQFTSNLFMDMPT